MLVRFFRINDPYRLLVVLVLMLLVSLPLLLNPAHTMMHELKAMILAEGLSDGMRLYSEFFTDSPPLAAWLSQWLYFVLGRSDNAWRAVSIFILFFQMAFFTFILINNKAHHENTYLPALIYGLLAMFSFDMLSFSPELIASTIILFALNELFKEIEFRIQRDAIVHNIGFFIGLSSLFVFGYILFLPGILILLMIFTRLSIRKAILLFFGFALPHLIIILIYFLRGELNWLIKHFYFYAWNADGSTSFSLLSLLILSAIPILFFLLSLIMLNRGARLTKYQSQLMQVMFLWLPISAITLAFSSAIKPHQLILFIPPLTYFISHYILLISRKRLAEITTWLFLIGIVSILYFSRFEILSGVSYQSLYVPESKLHSITDKHVLDLSEDVGLLKNNKLATGFYHSEMTRHILMNQDFYENVVVVDKAFQKSMPDVIVDPKNLMESVFGRIPSLKKQYMHEGNLYFRVD